MAGFDRHTAGARLERYVRARMGEAGIHSILALSERSRVNRNQLYDWFKGTVIPSPEGFGKLAGALGTGVGELYAVYDGLTDAPRTPEAIEVHELTRAVAQLIERLDHVAEQAIREEVTNALMKRGRPSGRPQ